MSKLLKTAIIGAAAGAAAAYFFSTEKGKEVVQKTKDLYDDYKENPEEYHQYASDKANAYKDLAVQTFNDYKERFDSGELTKDDIVTAVKEKTDQAADYASSKLSEFKQGFEQGTFQSNANKSASFFPSESSAQVDDIVIDYQQDFLTEDEK